MSKAADRRGVLWGLLGLWIGIELLFSSRWWPPQDNPLLKTTQSALTLPSLRTMLSQHSGERVWFAPYTTFPETGLLESRLRRGIYDTFLAMPAGGTFAYNYGAPKLSPADTLFSWASVQGLVAELALAKLLGYGWFVVDLSAVNDPLVLTASCQQTPGCRLSGDGYVLFAIPAAANLARQLATTHRRLPLLPYQSSGPSWGGLVFNPYQWVAVALRPSAVGPRDSVLLVEARPLTVLQLYRYPLAQFPVSVRRLLRLRHGDVKLRLAPDVRSAQICLGVDADDCRMLRLGGRWPRSLPIGDWFPAGRLSELQIQSIDRSQPGLSPFMLEVRGH